MQKQGFYTSADFQTESKTHTKIGKPYF